MDFVEVFFIGLLFRRLPLQVFQDRVPHDPGKADAFLLGDAFQFDLVRGSEADLDFMRCIVNPAMRKAALNQVWEKSPSSPR